MRTIRARGQAAVEFALGSLVFVTVLLFGIHFAEVGYLSAKVHEAGAAAMWDATAYRSMSFGHFYNAGADPVGSATLGGTGAADRYKDWDGRSSHNGSAPVMVMTQAQPMAVSCVDDRAITSYGLPAYAPSFGETGGVTCKAQGDFGFAFMRMPNKFAEGATGFFKAPHNSKIGTPTTLCSSGRASGGNCAGTLSILLGDDALADGSQKTECALQGSGGAPGSCSNADFYNVTHATWNKAMALYAGWPNGWTGMPENWADSAVSGVPGGQITGFYMSFRGGGAFSGTTGALGTNFYEPVEAAENGGNWQSSPMAAPIGGVRPYQTAYNKRNQCAGNSVSGWTGHGYCYLGKFSCK